jgi:probable F420-dependent oxidoreductase
VRLGLVTPVLSLNPRFAPPAWELDGDIDDVVAVAQAAESLGYDWLGCPEHVAIPVKAAEQRGSRYWDPVAALSYLAAHTSQMRLVSHVVVLGYHHPLDIVKRYSSLDVLSRGRFVLGVGSGSLRREFVLLGAEFEERGPLADDSLAAIRATWGRSPVSYHGTHHDFDDWIIDPRAVQADLRVWVGGLTKRSLRRAVELGDGWIPFGRTLDELGTMLASDLGQQAVARDGFDLVLSPEPMLDPLAEPDRAGEAVRGYADIGATSLALRFHSSSRAHYVEQLAAMVDVVAAAGHPLERG